MDIDYAAFEEADPVEHRASAIEEGDIVSDFDGGDPHLVVTLGHHGDRVLVTTSDGLELTYDSDEAVEVLYGPFDPAQPDGPDGLPVRINPFKVGDIAIRRDYNLDGRLVETVVGHLIQLRIGEALTDLLPHWLYSRTAAPKEA